MKLNEKGFSLIEMFAVLLISTTVLIPLLFSLINNVQINSNFIRRNAASLLTVSAIQGFSTMNYNDFPLLEQEVGYQGYLEFNENNCDTLDQTNRDPYQNNSQICAYVFGMTAQNVTFDATEFRVFIFPYYLTQGDIDALLALDDATIPPEVKDEIAAIPPVITVPDVLISRITVWIEYDSTNSNKVVRSGVISDD